MRAHLLHTIATGLLRRLHPAHARRRAVLARPATSAGHSHHEEEPRDEHHPEPIG